MLSTIHFSPGKIIISVAKGVGLWGRAKSKSLDESSEEKEAEEVEAAQAEVIK